MNNLFYKHKDLIVKDYVSKGYRKIFDGVLTPKEILRIQMELSIRKYPEYCEIFYENPDELDFPTWIEFEGVGYGWIALYGDDDKNRTLINQHIQKNLQYLLDKPFVFFKKNSEIVYYIFTEKDPQIVKYSDQDCLTSNIYDIKITLSNKKINGFLVE